MIDTAMRRTPTFMTGLALLFPITLSVMAALFVAMPVLLHQVWGFVAPGMYRKERRIALPLLVSSIVLFYAGMAFAFFVVFPMMFATLL